MTRYLGLGLLVAQPGIRGANSGGKNIAEQIVDVLSQPQTRLEYRVVRSLKLILLIAAPRGMAIPF